MAGFWRQSWRNVKGAFAARAVEPECSQGYTVFTWPNGFRERVCRDSLLITEDGSQVSPAYAAQLERERKIEALRASARRVQGSRGVQRETPSAPGRPDVSGLDLGAVLDSVDRSPTLALSPTRRPVLPAQEQSVPKEPVADAGPQGDARAWWDPRGWFDAPELPEPPTSWRSKGLPYLIAGAVIILSLIVIRRVRA